MDITSLLIDINKILKENKILMLEFSQKMKDYNNDIQEIKKNIRIIENNVYTIKNYISEISTKINNKKEIKLKPEPIKLLNLEDFKDYKKGSFDEKLITKDLPRLIEFQKKKIKEREQLEKLNKNKEKIEE